MDPMFFKYNLFLKKMDKECNKPHTGYKWCSHCNIKRFRQEFPNWTSGNNYIDNFIQESQLNHQNCEEVLEWIPFNRLDEKRYYFAGGTGTVYKVNWLDGPIQNRDYDKNKWVRNDNSFVVIKKLNNISENLFNELKIRHNCYKKKKDQNYDLIPMFGFTQDPYSLDYLTVTKFADGESLRNSLKKNHNWGDILYILYSIIHGLNVLHESDLIHCNLHDGNILIHKFNGSYIDDLGSCKPNNNNNNDKYGVIPFMAPEVLRGKTITPVSNIYSFAMIMWELTSRISPFYDKAHDLDLSLSICKGERPEIIEGTPQCYVDLMKKCWDLDPLQRPNTSEVEVIIETWYNNFYEFYYKDDNEGIKYLENIESDTLRKNLEEFWMANKALIKKQNPHPKAYYSSRSFDFTNEINNNLKQKE